MAREVATLPQLLREAGYSTWALGKWHLGLCSTSYWPTSRGFQHFKGFLGGAANYYTHRTDKQSVPGYDWRREEEVNWQAEGRYSTDLIRDEAVATILGHNTSQPLFLYLPFQAPHDPLMVDVEYQDIYSDIPSEDRQKYLGMVTAVDQAVGEVVEALQFSGMYSNTIIVFLSDNGAPVGGWPGIPGYQSQFGGSNFPLRGSKLTLWEGGTRVPAFIHAPALLAPRVEQTMVHVSDWFPTLLTAAGLPVPEGLDGLDLWPRLRDPLQVSPRQEMLYNIQIFQPSFLPHPNSPWPPVAALRQGDWKYIWRTFGYNGWSLPAEMGDSIPYPPPADVQHK